MRLEHSNGVSSLIDINHNEPKKTLSGRMPYVTVRENAVKWWITVQGLNHHEVMEVLNTLYFIRNLYNA
jgi:hypothetical protein